MPSGLSGAETFSVISARDSALSVARQVQLRAIQQESPSPQKPNKCQRLQVTDKYFGAPVDANCGGKEKRSDILDLSQSSIQISYDKAIIYFDLLGRPFDQNGQRLCVTADCQFMFKEGNADAALCLNSEGFFYACS